MDLDLTQKRSRSNLVMKAPAELVKQQTDLCCPRPSWPSWGRWLSPGSAGTPSGKAHSHQTWDGSNGRTLWRNKHTLCTAECALCLILYRHHMLHNGTTGTIKIDAVVSVYKISGGNMSSDPWVVQRRGPWHGRECHNCVIVPVAAAVCIINTCDYSGSGAQYWLVIKWKDGQTLRKRGGGAFC